MLIKSLLFLTVLVVCASAFSSFWAPLFNRRIINYRVVVNFDPDRGRSDRDDYVKNYGVRGERLIELLGNGRGPNRVSEPVYNDVKFYYTYEVDDVSY